MGTVVISLEPVRRTDLEVKWQSRGYEVVTLGAAFGNPVLPVRDVIQVRVYRPTGGLVENTAIERVLSGDFHVTQVRGGHGTGDDESDAGADSQVRAVFGEAAEQLARNARHVIAPGGQRVEVRAADAGPIGGGEGVVDVFGKRR